MFKSLADFYRSKEWETFRKVIIAERTKEDGFIYDEYNGAPLTRAYDIILHHKEELTEENVNDVNISLNPDNIMVVSFKSHNAIHKHASGSKRMRQVFLVYGAPLAGKTTWVKDNMDEGDLVIDMDSIWQCISAQDRYTKPNGLKMVAFRIRDELIDCVKYRVGYWSTAWIIGGFPLQSEREQLCTILGAREVFVDTEMAECYRRLEGSGRDRDAWAGYIADWFERYHRTTAA